MPTSGRFSTRLGGYALRISIHTTPLILVNYLEYSHPPHYAQHD